MRWPSFLAALAGTVAVIAPQGLPLDVPLPTATHTIYAPAGNLVAPSDASEFGLLSRLARVGAIPFGFEADAADPRPTTGAPVEAHDVAAHTLREALDGFVRIDPRYEWRDVAGVLVMRTRPAWTTSRGALSLPVRAIDWRDIDEVEAFNRVALLLYPNAGHPPFEGVAVSRARQFTVQLGQGTMLDLLNAIARADGQLGWAVVYGESSSTKRLTLTIGHYGNGPSYSWPTLPPGVS
ncbi:MAG TPA: hypothetical protein VGH34_20255 [Vicinamibacterales bacterium]